MRMRPKLGVLVAAEALYDFGSERAPGILSEALASFKALDLQVASAGHIVTSEQEASKAAIALRLQDVDLVCIVLATWTADSYILKILDEIQVPLVIWALPDDKSLSLCAAQLLCSVLKELGRDYRFLCGRINDHPLLETLERYSKAACLVRLLRNVRIGVIGDRPVSMRSLSVDELELKEAFGPSLIRLSVYDLISEKEEVGDEEAHSTWASIRSRVGSVLTNESSAISSTKTFLALRRLFSAEGFDAITVGCDHPKLKGEVCLALSLLNDSGIVAAPESDAHSTVAMLLMNLLTGRPIFNTDLISADEEDNSMVFSHCGCGPFSFANRPSEIVLDTHKEIKTGLAVFYPGRPLGRMTVVNLVGRKGTYRMCVATGEAVQTEMVYQGNPMRVRFSGTNVKQVLNVMIQEGFGHHWMLVEGEVSAELEEFCRLKRIKCVTIC
jgi:L-fucose isomerase-like protein